MHVCVCAGACETVCATTASLTQYHTLIAPLGSLTRSLDLSQLAADYFARTTVSFEEVALQFLDCPDKDAVRTYLKRKLALLRPQVRESRLFLLDWSLETIVV